MAFNVNSVDTDKQEEGIWEEYEGSHFRIAYANSPKFLAVKKRIEQPFKKKIEDGSIDAKKHRNLTAVALVKGGILLDWKDVVDGKTPIEFTEEVATTALELDNDFLAFVVTVAANQANYKREEVEETIKKSK